MDDLRGSRVVISQSMYFPWVGMLEQIRLADVFVHYDDVPFSRGGFVNRVQVKTADGVKWMTIPLRDQRLGQRIDEIAIDDRKPWRQSHKDLLANALRGAPYRSEAMDVVSTVFAAPFGTLAEAARTSLMALVDYFGLRQGTGFLDAAEMGIPGGSSQRVLELTAALGGTVYLTGHGARNYLDHDLFESSGIEVRYMDYSRTPYPQLHGAFTPYVTGLDLIANCGRAGGEVIRSGSVNWKDFINGPD